MPENPSSAESTVAGQWAELTRLLARALRSVQRLSADLEIAEAEWLLLWVCSQAGDTGTAQVVFAQALGVSAAQVSTLVERLREQGWLQSERCTQDRRRRLWNLTDEGRAVLQRASEAITRRLHDQRPDVQQDDIILLNQLLTRLVVSLHAGPAREGKAA